MRFSLHAAVAIHQNDRDGVEALCRYGLRPAIGLDSAIEFVCEPVELLTKLVALLPPPRKHLTRYHGVFAPSCRWCSKSAEKWRTRRILRPHTRENP